MRYYEIMLPASHGYACEQFEFACLARAGGFTKSVAHGGWRNSDGEDIIEPIAVYRVACDPDTWRGLCRRAQELFDDQELLFTAIIGQAELLPGYAAREKEAAE